MLKKILVRAFIYLGILLVLLMILIVVAGGGFGDKKSEFKADHPLIFAHRGVPHLAENSAEAFQESQKLGFKAVEIDIRLTKDHQLIVFHDESAERLSGLKKEIKELSLEEINSNPLLYNGQATQNKVLTLEQFADSFSNFQFIYLDLKVANRTLANRLLSTLEKQDLLESALIADSNLLFLAYLKSKNPNLKVVWEGFNAGKEWLYYFIPKNFKPDYYASFLSKVDENHAQFLIDKKLLNRKIVYGVDKDNFAQVLDFGLKNIILDYDKELGTFQEIEQQLKYGK